jgi:DNA-binding protein H-NS
LAILAVLFIGKKDFTMASYLELKQQAEEFMAKANEVRKQEITAIVSEMRIKIAEYGISAKDLGFASSRGEKKAKADGGLEMRFKGPNGELWSGLGRQPQWLKDEIAKGKDKAEFKI